MNLVDYYLENSEEVEDVNLVDYYLEEYLVESDLLDLSQDVRGLRGAY